MYRWGFRLLGAVVLVSLTYLAVSDAFSVGEVASDTNLLKARAGHKTKLIKQVADADEAETPPGGVLKLVKYRSPAGDLAAYVTPDPGDGKKRPAILWIFGGFSNGIGATAWEEATPANDQSAAAFRKAGLVMMYPSFRGGSGNPGSVETFYGEVDDVLAAADYLAGQPHVDARRIYLGGHSTGGTMALLVAEASDRFRAVFAFGPVGSPADYGGKRLVYDVKDEQENRLRSPLYHLNAIRNPTFVIEGRNGNRGSLEELKQSNGVAGTQFIEVPGADHFNVLAPMTDLLARKAAADTGDKPNIQISASEIQDAARKVVARQ